MKSSLNDMTSLRHGGSNILGPIMTLNAPKSIESSSSSYLRGTHTSTTNQPRHKPEQKKCLAAVLYTKTTRTRDRGKSWVSHLSDASFRSRSCAICRSNGRRRREQARAKPPCELGHGTNPALGWSEKKTKYCCHLLSSAVHVRLHQVRCYILAL